MAPLVTRQHGTTVVDEVAGLVCGEFVATYHPGDDLYFIFHLRLSGVWHRFHLDAGLLFWKSGVDPDPENDLGEGDIRQDLGARLLVTGVPLARVAMRDGCLVMEWQNGASATWRNGVEDCGATLIECQPAPPPR